MMDDWRKASPHELIEGFPKRHHQTFKALLYLYIFVCNEIPWSAVELLLEKLGFVKMDLAETIINQDFHMILSAPTYLPMENFE